MPSVSIIMPVFNTGAYLSEAIASVLDQHADYGVQVPDLELILVDDHSTDPATLAILRDAQEDARVRVTSNRHAKGAAGARNTAIEIARGEWIGFLDSDDLWFPNALVTLWQTVVANPEAQWIGAEFKLLKPSGEKNGAPVFESAATLFSQLDHQPGATPKSERIERPIAEFAQKCFLGTMAVLIKRSLVLEKGCFSEQLRRSSDYHLWFRCAFEQDLWLVDAAVGFYRIHGASLTHGNAPRHMHEDEMIEQLMRLPAGKLHSALLIRRLDFIMQDQCYFYRGQHAYPAATRVAWRWIRRRPLNASAWKELLASGLRVH